MGGRGSGGGRSSGGGGGATKNVEVSPIRLTDYYKEKYAQLSDSELNRAYKNAQNLLNKERAKLQHEENKLSAMVDEFKGLPATDPSIDPKWEAIEKQTSVVNDARSRVDIRSTAYYIAVNEKYNVRDKQTNGDLKKMTDGQLNSYYNKSYREGNKAKSRIEKTSNPKTRDKYQKIYETHNDNFFKANSERQTRGLDGKGW